MGGSEKQCIDESELIGETIPLQRWPEAAAQVPAALVLDSRGVYDALARSESACLGEGQKCWSKYESFGPSPYLAAQEGNYFQWRWNEHDEWKLEESHGHTIAGIRHGDTWVRAFT